MDEPQFGNGEGFNMNENMGGFNGMPRGTSFKMSGNMGGMGGMGGN